MSEHQNPSRERQDGIPLDGDLEDDVRTHRETIDWDDPDWKDCEYSKLRKPHASHRSTDSDTAIQALEELMADILPLARENLGYARDAGDSPTASSFIKNGVALTGSYRGLAATRDKLLKDKGRPR